MSRYGVLIAAAILLAECVHLGQPTTSVTGAATLAGSPAAPIVQEIYFVRHGETVANATGKYNGATLNKLSPTGEKQAAAVAKELAGVQIDAAIVSPSLRAELTAAETLREHHLKATIWPEFNECCTEHGEARKLPASKRLLKGAAVTVPSALSAIL